MFNTFLCCIMLRRSMLEVFSWLETACYEHFRERNSMLRVLLEEEFHVVKRFADKKQHIRTAFCKERAW